MMMVDDDDDVLIIIKPKLIKNEKFIGYERNVIVMYY